MHISTPGETPASSLLSTPSCARLEGGAYITGSCLLNFPPPFNVTNRWYTIDEELGAVDIFHNSFIDRPLPEDPGTAATNVHMGWSRAKFVTFTRTLSVQRIAAQNSVYFEYVFFCPITSFLFLTALGSDVYSVYT